MVEALVSIQRIKEDGYVGFDIETSQQHIKMMIEDSYICCEEYGIDMYVFDEKQKTFVLTNETQTEQYVGQSLVHVSWSNTNPTLFEDNSVASVEIECSKNKFLIVANNVHNGYYPHNIKVQWLKYGAMYNDVQEL
jgi:hypothetical protein